MHVIRMMYVSTDKHFCSSSYGYDDDDDYYYYYLIILNIIIYEMHSSLKPCVPVNEAPGKKHILHQNNSLPFLTHTQ